LGGDDYVGLDVHRAARIAATAHGGQTVLSESTAVLAESALPDQATLRDLGKHRLKDLSRPETLFQLVIEGLEEDFPPLRTLDAIPNNLPMQVTSFIGRRRELDEIRSLLEKTRLLTLTGPGGTGKTRLALQIGADLGGEFRDGVFFIDLAPVSDPEVVPSVVLSSLGVQDSSRDGDSATTLVESLRSRQVLMLLDNFEQIVPAAPLVAEMVRASPTSKFLVTSRAPLRLSAEQELPIEPMPVPVAEGALEPLYESDAVQLFLERAMAVRPDFSVDETNAADIAELVRILDGLPLAIELVASRVRLLPASAIVARLDSGMLGEGAVDLPERQRTIEGAIRWSHDLLEDPEKQLLARMAVFAGGARLEEIEAVCGPGLSLDVLDGLSTLLDQSLIRAVDADGESRFRMLHVIREFASRRLGEGQEEEEIRRRHLQAYIEFTEGAAPELTRRNRAEWLNRLGRDHDNLRTAHEWAVTRSEPDLARRLSFAAWRFWQARGHLHEAHRRTEAALALPDGDPFWRAKALEALGGILWWQAKTQECVEVYSRALAIQRRIGDAREVGNALYNHALALGFSATEVSQVALAEFDEAEELFRQVGDLNGLGDVSWGRGNLVALLGKDLETGVIQWERAIDYYQRAGNDFGLGWALFELGFNSRVAGRPDEAWGYLERGLRLFSRHEDVSAAVLFISLIGGVALDLGDQKRGVRLGGAFHALRIASGADIVDAEINRVEDLTLDNLEALTGDLREAYLEGSKMGYDEAVAYALAGPRDTPAEAPG
jgi:predicted ATPase